MELLLTIPESKRPGITHARNTRNASLPAEVQDGTDEEGAPIMVPNPDLHASDEEYIQWVVSQAVDSYNANLPPTPPPDPPVDPVTGQVLEVSKRQAHEELFERGLHDLLDPMNPEKSAVQACINLIPDLAVRAKVHNLFHNSTVFKRNWPELIWLWTAPAPNGLGLELADLDEAMTSASKR